MKNHNFRINKVLTTLLFAWIMYTIHRESPFDSISAAAIATVFGAYFLITCIDIISQCVGEPISDVPVCYELFFQHYIFAIAA